MAAKRYRTVFVTERSQRHQQDALAAAPPELDVIMLRQPARAELLAHLSDAVFLISERSGEIDAGLMAAAPGLKMILRLGSLPAGIDLDAARAAGIVVAVWPILPTILVAEHALLLMLALLKRLREVNDIAMSAGDWGPARRTDENVFAYNWSGRSDIASLWQHTVGILGFGEIGAELARRLRGFGCPVLYHRRHRLPPAAEADLGIRYALPPELVSQSDILVNLLPYSPETDHRLAAPAFAAMKPGAYLVSCGSGSVIDESALAEALRSGHLAGAAVDTYEFEPLQPDNPLRLLAAADPAANVILTPHTAAAIPPAEVVAMRRQEYTPLIRFLAGQPVPYRVA